MISIGIDPSLTATGVVVLDDGKLLESVLIKSKPGGKTPRAELERILEIRDDIMEVVLRYPVVDIVCMEGLAFMARNTTALVQLSALNYAIRAELEDEPFIERWHIVAPTSLKKFGTGAGNAHKDVMMMELYKKYGVTLSDNNIADAYALAQLGLAIIGFNASKKKQAPTKVQMQVVELLATQV